MLRQAGWLLAFIGFASAIFLDPWALGQDAYMSFPFRQAQTATLTMAFFLLSLSRAANRVHGITPLAARFAVAGATLYAGGWALAACCVPPNPLAAGGALLTGVGCGIFADRLPKRSDNDGIMRAALWTMAGGCALLALSSLWTLLPDLRPAYIGPWDGLRLRLLRLAQVAAFALPSLVLLLPDNKSQSAKWRTIMAWGAAGMPSILSFAAFTDTAVKYLLPLPALAVFSASAWAAWHTKKASGAPLAFVGWAVIAGSMGIGLFMGLYAFNGPVPAPPHFADYNDFVRRLSRLGHAYLILVGLLALFMASERKEEGTRISKKLFLLTSLGMLLVAANSIAAAARLVPPAALCVGPTLVTAAVCLHLLRPERKTA